MRFSIVIAGAFAALSYAQTTATSAASAQSSAQAAITACLSTCAAGDVDCQAHCISVPNPTPEQVNETNECVAACPQGNGTEAETQAYINCSDGCIAKYYYTATGGTPAATGASGSGSGNGNGNGSGATTTGTGSQPTGSSGSSTSASGSGASTTTASHNAAAPMVAGSNAIGFFGLLAAMLAL